MAKSKPQKTEKKADKPAEKLEKDNTSKKSAAAAAKPGSTPAPTRWVGESAVIRSGCAASSASSSRSRRSYSASGMLGSSRT